MKPGDKKKSKILGVFLGVLILILIAVFIDRAVTEEESKNPPPPPRVSTLIKTQTITLTGGQRMVFSTADPETGELCRYVPVWEQFTQDSLLQHSVHGELGEDGAGSRIVGAYLHPKLSEPFLKGDEKKNDEVYFVAVQNLRSDTVTFTVKFYGLRPPGWKLTQ